MDLTETFGDRYPRGRQYLARLDRLEDEARTAAGKPSDAMLAELEALAREALVANSLVSGQPILYVARRPRRPCGRRLPEERRRTTCRRRA